VWQFAAYYLKFAVQNALGSWPKTLQLALLTVVPLLAFLVVFGAATQVLLAYVKENPQQWGLVAGSVLAAAGGVSTATAVTRRRRTRRQILTNAKPAPADETPPTAQE
jgi:hypothetical protein